MSKEHMPFLLTLVDLPDLEIIAKDLTFSKVQKETLDLKDLKVTREIRERKAIPELKDLGVKKGILDKASNLVI